MPNMLKVLWYRVSHQPVLLVICRDPQGKEKDDYFFTTDATMTAAEVIGGYGDGWVIEKVFLRFEQNNR
jgi:hypothetical protein